MICCDIIPSFLLYSCFLQFFHQTVIICPLGLQLTILKISTVNTWVISWDGFNNNAIFTACNNISVGFINGSMNSSICWLFACNWVSQILSLKITRCLHQHWYIFFVTVHHKKYGGVTDSVTTYYFLSQKSIKKKNIKHLLYIRNACTIIDNSVWCVHQGQHPTPVVTHPPNVINVCASSSWIFHVGSLIPLSFPKSCTIISPAIGLKKHVWGIQELTPYWNVQCSRFFKILTPIHIGMARSCA